MKLIDKKNIVRKLSTQPTVSISIKISKRLSQWLKKNNFSPTKLFHEGCYELGYGKGE
jgi:hypothetical protein